MYLFLCVFLCISQESVKKLLYQALTVIINNYHQQQLFFTHLFIHWLVGSLVYARNSWVEFK